MMISALLSPCVFAWSVDQTELDSHDLLVPVHDRSILTLDIQCVSLHQPVFLQQPPYFKWA